MKRSRYAIRKNTWLVVWISHRARRASIPVEIERFRTRKAAREKRIHWRDRIPAERLNFRVVKAVETLVFNTRIRR